MGGEGDQYLDKSMTFQNQSPDVRGLESTEKKSRDWGNWICVKNLTEKQNLENEVLNLKEEIEKLSNELIKTRNTQREINIEDNDELEGLREELAEWNSK